MKLVDICQRLFHLVVPIQVRHKLFLSAPKSIRTLWERAGEMSSGHVDVNDVGYGLRLLHLIEPSQGTIEALFQHVVQYDFDLPRAAHRMTFDPSLSGEEISIANEVVPISAEIIRHAHRVFHYRNPTAQESAEWQDRLSQQTLTWAEVKAGFENSAEYKTRIKRESEPTTVDVGNFKICIRLNDYFTSAPIATTKSYEPIVSAHIEQLVNDGDTVFDLGANVGFHALHMASIVGSNGHVYAFEPNPGNCELINLSIEANQFNNLTLFPVAVGNKETTLELLVEGNHTNARLLTNAAHDQAGARHVPVQVVPISKLLPDLPALDFIKIDVEGAEPLAIAGMRDLIVQHQPTILLEFFPDFIRMTSQTEPIDFLNELASLGYRFQIVERLDVAKQPFLTIAEIMDEHIAGGKQFLDLLATPV